SSEPAPNHGKRQPTQQSIGPQSRFGICELQRLLSWICTLMARRVSTEPKCGSPSSSKASKGAEASRREPWQSSKCAYGALDLAVATFQPYGMVPPFKSRMSGKPAGISLASREARLKEVGLMYKSDSRSTVWLNRRPR